MVPSASSRYSYICLFEVFVLVDLSHLFLLYSRHQHQIHILIETEIVMRVLLFCGVVVTLALAELAMFLT